MTIHHFQDIKILYILQTRAVLKEKKSIRKIKKKQIHMIKHLWFLFAFQSIYEETQSSWLAPFALPISVFSKRIGG